MTAMPAVSIPDDVYDQYDDLDDQNDQKDTAGGADAACTSKARPRLAVVAAAQPVVHRRPGLQPGSRRARPASGARASRQAAARTGATPVRLTRRGRAVVLVLSAAAAGAAACLLSLAVAGGALAASHGPARAGFTGMRQVVVEPGQTLWSIASAAEPNADPRLVIQQIMQANSLDGATIEAGQELWVPRG